MLLCFGFEADGASMKGGRAGAAIRASRTQFRSLNFMHSGNCGRSNCIRSIAQGRCVEVAPVCPRFKGMGHLGKNRSTQNHRSNMYTRMYEFLNEELNKLEIIGKQS